MLRRRYNILEKAEVGNVGPQVKAVSVTLPEARYLCADLKFLRR